MRQSSLPIEFQGLSGKVNYVQKINSVEWSSSCPQCGGVPHKHGELPDRFRMWTNASGKNKVMGWCRHCGYTWFPDKDKPLDPQEMEKWRREQLQREERIKAEAEIAIANLRSERLWEKYHAALNEWTNGIIQNEWGISKEWADFWSLGMVADYIVYNKAGEYHSPGITIPLWQQDGNIGNIKVRVLNPQTPNDRYRSVYKIGTPFMFTAFPNEEYKTCFIAEGEKKAMVCAQWLQGKMQVVGVPTKTPNLEMLAKFDGYDKVIVCLDPDASVVEKNGASPLNRMVNALGKDRVRVLELPDKVDDMIVRHGLDIQDALRYTKKMEAK